jgi:hypothetical protein
MQLDDPIDMGPEDEDDFEERYPEEEDDDRSMFQDPGGNSALRRATASNPRIHRCPTCGGQNRLTQEDINLHYQCDECADAAELGIDGPDYWEEPETDGLIPILESLGFVVLDEAALRKLVKKEEG